MGVDVWNWLLGDSGLVLQGTHVSKDKGKEHWIAHLKTNDNTTWEVALIYVCVRVSLRSRLPRNSIAALSESKSGPNESKTQATWGKYMHQIASGFCKFQGTCNTVNVPFFIVLTVFRQYQSFWFPCVRVAALPLVSKTVTRDNGTQSQLLQRSRCTPGGRNILLAHSLSTCIMSLLVYILMYVCII